ncbi:TetR family transcriptional regulator [Streptomyces brasiliensis]|uniref:Transcriptional regulator n=1 Tax=Streptomyces brasiliensis TaxID=1954 RepID=A0A917L4D4_9ACTN|nr:TetR family transcriptional regulator [Streptomyces brasiliensis]GGJ42322.1 transcriptional regulator [Streptomyces brasiliensis]
MSKQSFQRARSTESKQQRADSLVRAARELALESGVRSVTLTAVAERAGVHHSAVRRYFDSHKDVLLRLAAQGWDRWADAVCERLHEGPVSPGRLAETLTDTLAADPLLCDLFANVPLHLEPDVEVDNVIAFKRSSRGAIDRMHGAIAAATTGFDDAAAFDAITATNALAATLWQVSHPGAPLAAALRKDPELMYLGTEKFEQTLARLLTATFTGLAAR